MIAILNYFDNPRLNEQQTVQRGSMVRANQHGIHFDLTADKEYETLEVNAVDLITIKNDKGKIDVYTVEYFYI